MNGDSTEYRETVHLTKDGRRLSVFLSVAPSRNEKGKITGVTTIVDDITERKQAEEDSRIARAGIKSALGGIAQTAAMIVEKRDSYTANHQRRVTELAEAIGRALGLQEEAIEGISLAASVHDVGKISIPSEILCKAGPLGDLEQRFIMTHPRAGYDILKDIEFPWPIAQIVLQHHEREQGSGYPQGLKSGEILMEAKIIAVADVVEAMLSYRPFRPAWSVEKTLQEIRQNRGKLYHPDVVDACLRVFERDSFRFKTSLA